MSKKVGILTFHNGPNFGGFMQAWHLVHAIRRLGYDACAVNYLHPTHHGLTASSNQPIKSISSLKGRMFRFLQGRGFRNLDSTICSHTFTDDHTLVPWKEFDALVVGSDVVWDYQSSGYGHDPVYFGGLPGLNEKPIIAYAASCGQASADGPFPKYVSDGLKKFNAIGIRDKATAKLAMNAGRRESTLVVDPTWLYPDPDIPWNGLPKKKYIVVYGRNVPYAVGEKLSSYCHSRGLALVSALTSCRQADKRYHILTPFQWVQLFKHAEATAIMGTLHGTLYSIKYNKPFVVLNSPKVSQKIAYVLERTNQEFRLLDPDRVTDVDLEMMDRDKFPVGKIPADWVSDSKSFLANSLQESTR